MFMLNKISEFESESESDHNTLELYEYIHGY